MNKKTLLKAPPTDFKRSPGFEITVAPIAPPRVIMMEGTSTYAPKFPPEAIDAKTKIQVARNPIRLVKSKFYAPLYFFYSVDSSTVFAIIHV